MSNICTCDASAVLPDIGLGTRENIGLVRRLFFQKARSAGATNVIDPATTDPTLKATWDTLIAAVDGTKVTTSPILEEGTATAGGAINYERSDGTSLFLSEEKYEMTFKVVATDEETHRALQTLICNAADPTDGLAMFIVNDCGNIYGTSSDNLVNNFQPFEIQYFFIDGDVSEFNRDTPQSAMITINLRPNWSQGKVSVTPSDFNALSL